MPLLGFKYTKESRMKMSNSRLRGIKEGRIKIWNKGKHTKINDALSIYMKKNGPWNKGLKGWTKDTKAGFQKGHSNFSPIGKNHYNWNSDREIVRRNRRDNSNADYHLWARAVKKRDNYKCKINNQDCSGRLEAHHILPWSQYPELRYEVNNGITLCQFHHPRKRNEEIKLAPLFQKMVLATAN